jgi:hypothetical protein
MTWFDWVVSLIRRVLSVLPPAAVEILWFPVFVVVLLLAFLAVARKGLPLLGRAFTTALGWLVMGAGAILLLADLIIASICRLSGLRPPGVVYAYGDIVSTFVIGLVSASGRTASAFVRLAKVNAFVIVLLCAGSVWWWNRDHCAAAEAAQPCVRPVASWLSGIGAH